MKTLSFLLLLLVSISIQAQVENHHRKNSQLNAKINAMGNTGVSLSSGSDNLLYNPAGIIQKDEIELSHLYDNNSVENTFQKTTFSMSLNERAGFAAAYSRTYLNEDEHYSDHFNMQTVTLATAVKLFEGLKIGASGQYLYYEYATTSANRYYISPGLIYTYELYNNFAYEHSLSFGACIENITGEKIQNSYSFLGQGNIDAPMHYELGANYTGIFGKSRFGAQRLNLFQPTFAVGLGTRSGIAIGGEAVFYEIIALRSGASNLANVPYYHFGACLQLPLYKLTDVPLKIGLEANTNSIKDSEPFLDLKNFYTKNNYYTVFAFKLVYSPAQF